MMKRLFMGDKESKSVAKSRLHFVLVQDRAGLTNEEMASFKKELVECIEKYFVIDETGFDIDYEREGDSTTLLINSPVIVKRQQAPAGVVGSKRGKNKKKKSSGSAAQAATA